MLPGRRWIEELRRVFTSPSQTGGAANFDFSRQGNPQVAVTMQRTDVPTYFAHIFGQRLVTVTAKATAEAYNSSLPPSGGTNMSPVAPACVKPWMVVNIDPNNHGAGPNQPFVKPDGSLQSLANGAWTGPGTGVVGEPLTMNNVWLPVILVLLGTPGYLPVKLNAVLIGQKKALGIAVQ
jgi:hypothetical protein